MQGVPKGKQVGDYGSDTKGVRQLGFEPTILASIQKSDAAMNAVCASEGKTKVRSNNTDY